MAAGVDISLASCLTEFQCLRVKLKTVSNFPMPLGKQGKIPSRTRKNDTALK